MQPTPQNPPTEAINRPGRSGNNWETRLEPLLDAPGQWHLIHQAPTKKTAAVLTSMFRTNKVRLPDPDGEWEFVYDDEGSVYARYHGPTTAR